MRLRMSSYRTSCVSRRPSSSPVDALASAQRALIRDPKYAAPYYWAAYTVSGSGRLE